MHSLFRIVLIALFFSQSLDYAISSSPSPFQKPGGRVHPRSFPKPGFRPPNLAQKPNKQEDHSKDVEFRGYFYLNGKPRFCLFNVKAQFSEWVILGGTTVEEFNAVRFHEESETLTVAYKNHPDFNLNLYGPSSAPSLGSPASSRTTAIPARLLTRSNTQPKVMPPVPQFKPPLPPSVVSSRPQLGTSGTSRSVRPASSIGTRAHAPSPFPVFPRPSFPGVTSGQRSPVVSVPASSANPISKPVASVPSSSVPGSNPAPDSNPTPNPDTGTELDLSTLPPPPPPPNILPPSAPPNIEPSREGE